MMRRTVLLIAAALFAACNRAPDASKAQSAPGSSTKPSILLITLDTTRADAIGPEARGIETPAFNAIAARGRRFRQAYATVPETLPSHTSMMTGLYPAGHGIHQNARYVPASASLLAERLRGAGYRTAAFVSSFALAARFGLARGFELYDDGQAAGGTERSARETTEAALRHLSGNAGQPLFLWVHYYDPHTPYAPPEPFRSRFAANAYLGEVAAMDEQMGRLTQAFERAAAGPAAFVIVADHGEGLGDHGEPQHGQLLYQSTMHVPFVVAGPGIDAAVVDTPVSTRRVFHTVAALAGLDGGAGLQAPAPEARSQEARRRSPPALLRRPGGTRFGRTLPARNGVRFVERLAAHGAESVRTEHLSVRADPGSPDDLHRGRARCSRHPNWRGACRSDRPEVAGRLDRALGGRHARRGHHELHAEIPLQRIR